MKITKKDILYLKWLALFVGFYVFWAFIWTPMTTNLAHKQVELKTLETNYLVAEQTIPTHDLVAANQVTTKNQAAVKFAKFWDVLTPAQSEAILIPLLQAHGAKITFFQATEARTVIPQTTLKTDEQLTYKIKELVDIYNHITTPVTSLPVTQSQLLKTQITYLLEMSFENYTALLNTIDQMDVTILLSSSNYDFNDRVAEIVFDIYSIEKIKFTE